MAVEQFILVAGAAEVDAEDEIAVAFGGGDQARFAVAGHVIDAGMFHLRQDAFIVHSRIFLKLR